MNEKSQVIAKLTDFIQLDKFKAFQHLQPAVESSTEEDKLFVNNEMNTCCNKLLAHLHQDAAGEEILKATIRESMERIKDKMLDTEDEEFCYELYHQIAEIVGISLQDDSNDPQQLFMQQMERIAKQSGLDLSQFFPKEKGSDKA